MAAQDDENTGRRERRVATQAALRPGLDGAKLYCVPPMSSSGSAVPASPTAPATTAAAAHAPHHPPALDRTLAALVAGCVVLGILSALILTWPPGSDPFAWIDWGQAIASSKIALSLAGGPSWKPFPVAFTAVFGLFGSAAPALWLMVSRSAGLLALLGAYRLARRFGGVLAGVLAVIALLLVQDALFYFARGASETLVAALTLWAVDRHLNGSLRLAYVLGFLAAMNRPEFGAFLLLYAIYLWPRLPGFRLALVAGIVLIPVAWFGAPGVISGNAFQAGNAALGGKGSPGSALAELRSGFSLMTVPIAVLSVLGLAVAYLRRELVVVWLGLGAVAWALMEAIFTQIAYGLPRYLLPAAVIGCVLAALAVVWGAQEARERLHQAWAAPAVVALLLVLTLPWTITRAGLLSQQASDAGQAAVYIDRMNAAVDRVGGAARVLPCRGSRVAVNHTLASALAFKLQVPEYRVTGSMRGTGFMFVAPHVRPAGAPPPIAHRAQRTVLLILHLAPWRVFEVTRLGASPTPNCHLSRPRAHA